MSLCALRKEHEFPPRPVGRASDFLEGVAVCDQIRLDLVALAETKCRVRRQNLSVRSEHICPTERHQRSTDIDDLNPGLDSADTLNLGDLLRGRAVPL